MIEKRVCIKTKTAVLIIRAPEYFRVFWKHSLCVQKKVWLTFHFTHITHTIYFPPEYFCLDSQSRNTSSTLAFRKTRRNKGFISPCWLIILNVLHLVFNQTFIFECCWHEASAVRPSDRIKIHLTKLIYWVFLFSPVGGVNLSLVSAKLQTESFFML